MHVDLAGGVRTEDRNAAVQQLLPSYLRARCTADHSVVLIDEDRDLGLRVGCD
jgi:hypothetical protein